MLVEENGQSACCNYSCRTTDFFLHSGNQPFDQGDIAPEDTNEHLAFGIAPDNAVIGGFFYRNAWKLSRVADQGIERKIDAGCNDATLVSTVEIDDIKRRRSTEIDEDQVAIVFRVSSQRI